MAEAAPSEDTADEMESAEQAAGLWLERAYIAAALLHDPEQAAEAARSAVELADDPLGRAKAGAVLIGTLVELGRDAEASEALKARGQALIRLGKGQLAETERRLGFLLFGRADFGNPQHLELLRTELARAQKFGDPETVTVVGAALAGQVWAAATPEKPGQLEEAVALVRLSIAAARGLSDPQQTHSVIAWAGCLFSAIDDPAFGRESAQLLDTELNYILDGDSGLPISYLAAALQARAQLHGRAGEFAEAVELADERAQLCLDVGAALEAFEALIFSAALHSKIDQDAVAVQRAAQALSLTGKAVIEPQRAITVHFNLGQYQLWSGDPQSALATLQAVSGQETAFGLPDGARAETLIWRGRAANACQDQEQAKQSWAEAMQLADQAELPEAAAMAGIDLAQALLAAQDEAVLPVVERALAAARQAGVPQFLVHALDVSGRAKTEFDDASGLADLDEAAELAAGYGAEWNVADVLDSRGRALLRLGRLAEAAQTLDAAAGRFAAVGDGLAAAMAQLARARGLAVAEDFEPAYSAYAAAVEQLAGLGEPAAMQHQAVSVEFAQLLDEQGFGEAAQAVRGGALR